MKRLFGVILIAVFVGCPVWANAWIIGDVDHTESYSDPTGWAHFPSQSATWYLDYDASNNGASAVESFCVEDSSSPTTTTAYTLLTLDSGLSSFGLNASRYLAAATVAEYYYTHYEGTGSEEAYKGGAQIAVWEIIMDYTAGFNLGAGNFYSYDSTHSNAYTDEATTIWNAVKDGPFLTSASDWVLAVNPTIAEEGTVTVTPTQNYMVR